MSILKSVPALVGIWRLASKFGNMIRSSDRVDKRVWGYLFRVTESYAQSYPQEAPDAPGLVWTLPDTTKNKNPLQAGFQDTTGLLWTPTRISLVGRVGFEPTIGRL
jgi:hypothetical protein